MFCGECGAKNLDTSQFCEECGKPLEKPLYGTIPLPVQGFEQIISVIPYLEQGSIFLDKFTLIITSQRLIFAKVPSTLTGPLDEKAEEIDDGWAEYNDLAQQRTYLNSHTCDDGPWHVYSGMHPDAIAAESPKNISIPLANIEEVNVTIDREMDFVDEMNVLTPDSEHGFSLNYAAGDHVVSVLRPLLNARLRESDKNN